ncbi:MAG: hypothetical protein WEB57_05580 [Pseudohongiellaceae bacterium]
MYACLDLGSNSFHLLIARFEQGRMIVVERFSEKVQLGEGVAINGVLSDAAMRRGSECLHHFREVIDAHPADCLWSVGTNALRKAGNAGIFLREARLLGFDIEVISGEKEGALVYAGVSSLLSDEDEPRLVVDIGGGSTEIVSGEGNRHHRVVSLPMGCVSWRDRFFSELTTEASREDVDRALDASADEATAILSDARETLEVSPQSLLAVHASSGTAKMLAVIAGAQGEPARMVSRDGLDRLRREQLLHRLVEEPDWLVPGLKPARRDLLLPGWTLVRAFMDVFDVPLLAFSPSALREGMLATMRAHRVAPDEAPVSARMQWRDGTAG